MNTETYAPEECDPFMALPPLGRWPICMRGEFGAETLERRLCVSGSTSDSDPVFIFFPFLPEKALVNELLNCNSETSHQSWPRISTAATTNSYNDDIETMIVHWWRWLTTMIVRILITTIMLLIVFYDRVVFGGVIIFWWWYWWWWYWYWWWQLRYWQWW